MLRTKQLCWALAAVLGMLAGASSAGAQSTTQPSAEGFALYDRLLPSLTAKSGIAAPDTAETAGLGCQRYGQVVEALIRFALAASVTPGVPLDSPHAEMRRQATDLMVDDAQGALSKLAAAGATTEQCGQAARSFGAAAFTLARTINAANVDRAALAVAGPEKKPEPGKSAEEIAEEEAAKAAMEKAVREEDEARRLAADKVDHAFANLHSVAPVPPRRQAAAFAFDVYLLDTPAMREAKDFRVCFEPALYQRAAKPIVDLASAALEVPEIAPIVDPAVTDFFDRTRKALAARMDFPVDRLKLELGDGGLARGPVAQPIKAVSDGCHVYLASRVPPLAHDDATTTFGLITQDVVEDVVTQPALEIRVTALSMIQGGLKPITVLPAPPDAGADAVAEAAPPPPPTPAIRPDIVRCSQNARCLAGATLAINACMQAGERRYGKAAIARELEARRPVKDALDKDLYNAPATRDFALISSNLELVDRELNQTLNRLADDGKRLRSEASAYLSNQQVDALIGAGRNEGEQTMGAPALQCFSRMADGRSLDLMGPE